MHPSTMSAVTRLNGCTGKSSTRAYVAPKARSRKPLQFVDTNLSSYDRKDPFAAFNALRKLLSGLSARIGAAQLKFSPEEYKLSLHLLTIVEPVWALLSRDQTCL